MLRKLVFALRFNPLELVGGFLLFGYSIIGVYINAHVPTNDNFVSAVSIYVMYFITSADCLELAWLFIQ